MSINFIYDLQVKLYQLFANDQEISKDIDNIYLAVVQDAQYPFLLIKILKLEDISESLHPIYDVEFEICAFAKGKNQNILILLADKIANKLNLGSTYLKDYIIAGIRVTNITFDNSQDLVTSKLTMTYKALIKREMI
jgi:hypothetical protein